MRCVGVVCLALSLGCNGDAGQEMTVKELVELLNQKGVKCQGSEKEKGGGVYEGHIKGTENTRVVIEGRVTEFPPPIVFFFRCADENQAKELATKDRANSFAWRRFIFMKGTNENSLYNQIREALGSK
jgi:hypothetical protein